MIIDNLAHYNREKERLLGVYEKISRSDLIPIYEITESEIQAHIQKLQEKRFIVAVCGQMNSGKSTLLNAIVFRDDVLPVDDTVMTAKNTTVKLGDPGFEIIFYSSEEWTDLLSNLDERARTELLSEANRAASFGAIKSECIRSESKKDSLAGYAKLAEYTAPVSQDKGGVFTPFVKEVTLYSNHEWLREGVIIVDTPGVNDPNPYRDSITKRWINNADAVVFVAFAGQALGGSDLEFINNYLLHIQKDHRIIAVNKTDIIEDVEELKRWLRKLQLSDDLRIKGMYSDEDNTFLISALGALINYMQEDGIPLPEELKEMSERLDGKGYLDPEKNHLDSLTRSIERHFIDNSGASVIESQRTFLKHIFVLNQRKQEILRQEKESSLQDIAKSKAELEEDLRRIKQENKFIADEEEKFRRVSKRDIRKLSDPLRGQLSRIRKEIAICVGGKISRFSSINDVINQGPWAVLGAIDDKHQEISDIIYEFEGSISDFFEKIVAEMKYNLRNIYALPHIDYIVDLETYKLLNTMRVTLDEQFGDERVEEIIKKVTNVLARIMPSMFPNKRQAAKDELIIMTERELSTATNRLLDDVGDTALVHLKKFGESIAKSLLEASLRKKRYLKELVKRDSSFTQNRANLEREIELIEERLHSIDCMQKEWFPNE